MLQILAWNGGGSRNYSSIISKGAHESDRVKTMKLETLKEIENFIDEEVDELKVEFKKLLESTI